VPDFTSVVKVLTILQLPHPSLPKNPDRLSPKARELEEINFYILSV